MIIKKSSPTCPINKVIMAWLGSAQPAITRSLQVDPRVTCGVVSLSKCDVLTSYLNVASFQIHRRGRALRKLAKQLTDGHVAMTPRSLQDYIMPYAMTALLDEKMLKVDRLTGVLQMCIYGIFFLLLLSCLTHPPSPPLPPPNAPQHEGMISASVEVVGAVCSRLTWSKYLYYLKHFVHILQTSQVEQKLAVKWGLIAVSFFRKLQFDEMCFVHNVLVLCCLSLLVTVLEAFHFDHQTLSREMEAAKARDGEGSASSLMTLFCVSYPRYDVTQALLFLFFIHAWLIWKKSSSFFKFRHFLTLHHHQYHFIPYNSSHLQMYIHECAIHLLNIFV